LSCELVPSNRIPRCADLLSSRPAGPEPKGSPSGCADHRTSAISRYQDAGRKHRSALGHAAGLSLRQAVARICGCIPNPEATEVDGTELNPSLAPDPGPSRDDAMADPCSGSTSLLEFRRFVRPTLLRSAAVPGSVAPGAVSCNALLGRLRERAPRMSLSRSCAALESALLRLVVCLLGFGRHQTLNHLVRDAKEFADVAPAELQVMS
jgi:hypothetical protein